MKNKQPNAEDRHIMNATRIQRNPTCGSGFHEDRLCCIAAQGFNLEDPVKYSVLIDDPQHRCDHCGRHANTQENLCRPEPL